MDKTIDIKYQTSKKDILITFYQLVKKKLPK